MKSIILSLSLIASTSLYAQVNFDHKAERKKVEKEIKTKAEKMTSLYADLYDDEGNEDPAVRAQIDLLNKEVDVAGAKYQYLWGIGFEKANKEYKTSKNLKHFKKASNRYAAVVAKDSKGQILSYESIDDLINNVYDKDIEKNYGCYNSDGDQSERSLPYEEDQAPFVDTLLNGLGYENYQSLRDQNYKTFCEIEKTRFDENNQTVECNNFLSGARISLLEEMENKVQQKRDDIKKTGYFNTSDQEFIEFDVLNNVKNEIEDQVKNIEAVCLDIKLGNNNEAIFDYLEDEISKDRFEIEYNNFNIQFQSNRVRNE